MVPFQSGLFQLRLFWNGAIFTVFIPEPCIVSEWWAIIPFRTEKHTLRWYWIWCCKSWNCCVYCSELHGQKWLHSETASTEKVRLKKLTHFVPVTVIVGLKQDACWHGPLTRYVKSRVPHAPGMPGTFSRHRLQKKPSRTCRDAWWDRWTAVAGKTFPTFPAQCSTLAVAR